jgi:hypothetical protein
MLLDAGAPADARIVRLPFVGEISSLYHAVLLKLSYTTWLREPDGGDLASIRTGNDAALLVIQLFDYMLNMCVPIDAGPPEWEGVLSLCLRYHLPYWCIQWFCSSGVNPHAIDQPDNIDTHNRVHDDWRQHLIVGSRVNLCDIGSISTWLRAQVVAIQRNSNGNRDDDMLTLRYIGWSVRFDQEVTRSSDRMCALNDLRARSQQWFGASPLERSLQIGAITTVNGVQQPTELSQILTLSYDNFIATSTQLRGIIADIITINALVSIVMSFLG